MELKKVMGEEHLIDCHYGEYLNDFVKQCNCMLDNNFVIYFTNKYPYHLATIAQNDKEAT